MNCRKCQGSNFDENEQAEIVCVDCGFVFDTNLDDEEENFDLDDGGRAFYVGRVILNGKKPKDFEGRKNSIFQLCGKLSLSDNVANTALDFYTKLLQNQKTKSVPEKIVIGVCVYMAARAKRHHVLLLDVSARTGVSVYKLGHIYKKWRKVVCPGIANINRLMFMRGYAARLELGEHQEAVEKTAARLIYLMDFDNFGSGVKSNEISVVALLVACRIHGFERDYADLTRASSIRQGTLKKLIQKWTHSSSAKITNEKLKAINSRLESLYKESENGESSSTRRDVDCEAVSSDGESIDLGKSDDDEDISSYLFSKGEQMIMSEIYGKQNQLETSDIDN